MHQEAVVDPGERIDGVDVGGEEHRRLGLAEGDDVLRAQSAEDAGAASEESADLGEDVEGEGVARVIQACVS